MKALFSIIVTGLTLFSISWGVQATSIDARQFDGEWKVSMVKSLYGARYDEGKRYFPMENMTMVVNSQSGKVTFKNAHYFEDKTYPLNIKSSQLVAMLKPKQEFNYQDKKMLLKPMQKGKYLKGSFRPEKKQRELEVYFIRKNETKEAKEFKVKYGVQYLSQDKIDGAQWSMTFNKNGQVKIGKVGQEKTHSFTTAFNKKVFINRGEFMVKAHSKMITLYSEKYGTKLAFVPQQ